MLIRILTRGFPLTAKVNEYADSKIRLALGLYSDRIAKVNVVISDCSSLGGNEKIVCRISIQSGGKHFFSAQETAYGIFDAINICSQRIKRAASRHFDNKFHLSRAPVYELR